MDGVLVAMVMAELVNHWGTESFFAGKILDLDTVWQVLPDTYQDWKAL